MANLTEEKQIEGIQLLKNILFDSSIPNEYDQQIHDYLESIGEDVSNSYLSKDNEEDF